MTNNDTKSDAELPRNPPFIIAGIGLAVCFWIFEGYVETLLVEDVSFVMRLLPADAHEFWMRSFTCALFICFGIYSQLVHTRIRKAERISIDAAWLLKNALSNTIRGHYSYCAFCKKIRTQDDRWVEPAKFIVAETEAVLSMGICPQCQIQHPPD